MKKLISIFCLSFCFLFIALNLNALPLTGTKNIPGDYPTLALAITDLNLQGVGAGGVIINLIAENPEIAPLGGYVIGGSGSLVLTTSSAFNTITIQGNANTITAPNPQTSGNLNDAVFKLIGADWITLTGFTMLENPANIITAAGTNNMTEWGVALLYVTTTDGAQNNIVSSNIIDLNRVYQNTFGIYSNSTHSASSVTASASATTSAGGNSNLTVIANIITDINIGIVVIGPTAAADNNDGLTIGGTALNVNTITNYGTTNLFSGYANVSLTVNGILVRNTKNLNVSFNTVSSSVGGVISGILNGINLIAFSNAPAGTFTNTINNNNISLQSGVAVSAINGILAATSTATTTSSLNINNNNFNNFGHTVSGFGTITFITVSGSATTGPLNTNINGNTFTNISVNTTGSVTFISNRFTHTAGSVVNVNNNSVVTAFGKTGSGGSVYLYDSFGSSPSTVTETNTGNNFSNLTFTGTTIFNGWRSADGATPGSRKTVTNNIFSNISCGTGAVTVLTVGFSDNTFSSNNVSGNLIKNISGAFSITGITSLSGNQNFFMNTIGPLSSSGSQPVIGISIEGGVTQNIFKNKIYDLISNHSTGTVNGIMIIGGSSVNISNNLVGNLSALATSSTTDAIRGINLLSSIAVSNVNLSYNTIYIQSQTSSGTNFSSSGVYHTINTTSTTAQLTMKNNIIVDLAEPNGSGNTSAYRRSSGTAGTLANYSSASNNNLFYAGTQGPARFIYSDGVSTASTIAAYKSGIFTAGIIAPRDAQSVSEYPNFMSTTGLSPNFLHIDSTISSQIESGASIAAEITDDYDGQPRFPDTGYPNNISFPATAPDIGADEFGGITSSIPNLNDVGVNAITSSLGLLYICTPYGATDFTVTVKNFGTSAQTIIPVYYTVNSGSQTGPVNTAGPIPANGSENVVFSGASAFTPPGPGTYVIKAYTALTSDTNRGNDTATTAITVNQIISTFPFVESWNNQGAGWSVKVTANVGNIPIYGLAQATGPKGTAGDTGMRVNFFNGSAGRIEILQSPPLNLSSLTNPVLGFYIAYKTDTGGKSDTIQVMVSTDCGVTFSYASTIYNKSWDSNPSLATRPPSSSSFVPDSAIQWRHETVSLANAAGEGSVILGFRAKSDFGNLAWIDDIIVTDVSGLCTDNITGSSSYSCNPLLTIAFTSIPAPPPGPAKYTQTGGINRSKLESSALAPLPVSYGQYNVNHNGMSDNPSGGTAVVSQYVNINPGQIIAPNVGLTNATPPSGPAYDPIFVYHDYWFTVTYTGNDYSGYATYNIKIDLDGLVFTDPSTLYIVKRADGTGSWICQNTTMSGNTLIVTGLTTFCDFAIAGSETLPVELSSFVSTINGRNVDLNWSTTSENNNFGFDVERSNVKGQTSNEWIKVGNVAGNGTTSTDHSYSYTDRNVALGNYSYRLKQIDFNGNFEYFNLSKEVNVGIPTKFDLSQNYPNPFNPSTNLEFGISDLGFVSLKVYNASGREVATLVNEVKTAGYYSINFSGLNLSSGIYFYTLKVNNFTATKKMMLIK